MMEKDQAPLSLKSALYLVRRAPLHSNAAPLLVTAWCALLLSSCQTGSNPDQTTKAPPPAATTPSSTGTAAAPPAKVVPAAVPNPPPPSVKRGLLLKRYPPAGASDYGEEEGPKGPQYDAHRLKKAAQIRLCEPPVKLEEYGTKCFLRTKWENGKVTLSLQLHGPREALNGLLQSVSQFRVKLQDPLGNDLTEYTLLPQDFKWASGHSPMIFFESDAEMPLETYERVLNWHFFYDY